MGKDASISVLLDGRPADIEDWRSIPWVLDFTNSEDSGANIDQVVFVGRSLPIIDQHFADGFGTESIKFELQASDALGNSLNYTGYVDIKSLEFRRWEGRVSGRVIKVDTSGSFRERLRGLTWAGLQSKGNSVLNGNQRTYFKREIPYVVSQPISPIQSILILSTIYQLTKAGIDAIKELFKDGAHTSSKGESSGIWAAFATVINIAANASNFIAATELARQLIAGIFPISRTHKLISYAGYINAIVEELGYRRDTDDENALWFVDNCGIDINVCYLPSNQNVDVPNDLGFIKSAQSITNPIPNGTDAGYFCADMMDIVEQMYNARFRVDDQNRLVLDPLFKQGASDYILPPTPLAIKSWYNADEIKATTFIGYATDTQDRFTVKDFDANGTVYEINVSEIAVKDQSAVNINGSTEVRIPTARASRYGGESVLVRLLGELISVADATARLFGGGFKERPNERNRQNYMVVGDNNHSVPKSVYVQYFDSSLTPLDTSQLAGLNLSTLDFGLSPDHASNISSEAIFEGLGNQSTGYRHELPTEDGQYEYFEFESGFSISDVLALITDNFCQTEEGKQLEIRRVEYRTNKALVLARMRFQWSSNFQTISE